MAGSCSTPEETTRAGEYRLGGSTRHRGGGEVQRILGESTALILPSGYFGENQGRLRAGREPALPQWVRASGIAS